MTSMRSAAQRRFSFVYQWKELRPKDVVSTAVFYGVTAFGWMTPVR
jgi:hypothetical protein